jgi:hypothetical protein
LSPGVITGREHVSHWDPDTPWERLPKWARVLLMALIVAVLLWLIFTLTSYIAGAGVVTSTNLRAIDP